MGNGTLMASISGIVSDGGGGKYDNYGYDPNKRNMEERLVEIKLNTLVLNIKIQIS